MRAVAILGPNSSWGEFHAFNSPNCTIRPVSAANPLEGADAALIFGGDGTIHRHLSAISAAKVPVLMVPRGSGNDFARALGIRSPAQALAAWHVFRLRKGNARDIDLGVIRHEIIGGTAVPNRSTFFCCAGGTGLDAEANRRANAMPRWLRARGGYLAAAVIAVMRFPPRSFAIATRGDSAEAIAEAGLMLAFANAPAYGHGIRIAPRARLDDGLLDICFVRAMSRARLLRLLPKVFSGQHVYLREVEYFKAAHLWVEPQPPLPVYADGEYVCPTPVEVSVAPKALRVIVP